MMLPTRIMEETTPRRTPLIPSLICRSLYPSLQIVNKKPFHLVPIPPCRTPRPDPQNEVRALQSPVLQGLCITAMHHVKLVRFPVHSPYRNEAATAHPCPPQEPSHLLWTNRYRPSQGPLVLDPALDATRETVLHVRDPLSRRSRLNRGPLGLPNSLPKKGPQRSVRNGPSSVLPLLAIGVIHLYNLHFTPPHHPPSPPHHVETYDI